MQTSEEFSSSINDYILEGLIGRGAFAEVKRGKCINPERDVAIKIIDLDSITSDMEDIRQEVATLRLCNHPNVLKYHVSFVYEARLWLVTQLMDKGSCLYVMNEAKKILDVRGLKEAWLAWILRETLLGLMYFHEHSRIHRDIKAGNILLDGRGKVVIADFGVSRWVKHGSRTGSLLSEDVARTFVGTPCWMAPEVMEQLDGYDFKADIWSFGITALELAKGQAPYANHSPMKVLLCTIQNDPPSLKTYDDEKRDGEPFSQNFKQMTRMCLKKDPKLRPTCARLLSHAFFKKVQSPDLIVNELLQHIDDVRPTEDPDSGIQLSLKDEMTAMDEFASDNILNGMTGADEFAPSSHDRNAEGGEFASGNMRVDGQQQAPRDAAIDSDFFDFNSYDDTTLRRMTAEAKRTMPPTISE
eukprot:CAMPEP_0185751716 /NCGR_PEP_ID=MMETSP1174-20130828/10493_1 /TAXON_ID=35687 /ORGANISM="Dictyocha speculum, Strain CCMP1381" /LENGTH=413 /DNA_ID=CAMNT_0028428819 /DNA_START=57 /DNA_END=1298 /DNA_ORIENTATION=+